MDESVSAGSVCTPLQVTMGEIEFVLWKMLTQLSCCKVTEKHFDHVLCPIIVCVTVKDSKNNNVLYKSRSEPGTAHKSEVTSSFYKQTCVKAGHTLVVMHRLEKHGHALICI